MDVMTLRRRLLPFSSELPFAYKKVDYLESSGSQYILTSLTQIYGYKIKIQTLDSSGFDAIGYFGWWNANTQSEMQWYPSTTNHGIILAYGSDNNVFHISSSSFNGIIVADGTRISANEQTFTANEIPPNLNIPFVLFGYNRSTGVVNYAGSCRIYSAEFWDENHATIGKFIPCIRKADNKPGMYDTVSGNFYTNRGTSEFIIPS